jgi:hypothetical protein
VGTTLLPGTKTLDRFFGRPLLDGDKALLVWYPSNLAPGGILSRHAMSDEHGEEDTPGQISKYFLRRLN